MFNSGLILFREGLEAALIIGLMVTVLNKTAPRYLSRLWAGTAAGIVASILIAVLFSRLAGGFEGRAEEIFEGALMIGAVILITLMLWWMKQNSQHLKSDVKQQLQAAVATGKAWAIFALALVTVAREGAESVIFLTALRNSASILGSAIGVLLAVVVGYLVYRATIRIDLNRLFNILGVGLIIVAAGILGRGIHELEEARLLPPLVEHLWNWRGLLSQKSGLGSLLNSTIGYRDQPSLLTVIAYLSYLGGSLWWYLRPGKSRS